MKMRIEWEDLCLQTLDLPEVKHKEQQAYNGGDLRYCHDH